MAFVREDVRYNTSRILVILLYRYPKSTKGEKWVASPREPLLKVIRAGVHAKSQSRKILVRIDTSRAGSPHQLSIPLPAGTGAPALNVFIINSTASLGESVRWIKPRSSELIFPSFSIIDVSHAKSPRQY